MARVNISLPDDVRARMSRAAHINWSGVCRVAIERELRVIEALKAEDRIEVLRAKRDAAEEHEFERGREDGAHVDVDLVEWSELVIAEKMVEGMSHFYNEEFASRALIGYEKAGSDLIDNYELNKASPAYVRGFVVGLAELKAEVG